MQEKENGFERIAEIYSAFDSTKQLIKIYELNSKSSTLQE